MGKLSIEHKEKVLIMLTEYFIQIPSGCLQLQNLQILQVLLASPINFDLLILSTDFLL